MGFICLNISRRATGLNVLGVLALPLIMAFQNHDRSVMRNEHASLRVQVAQIDLAKGLLQIAVYNSPDHFLSHDAHLLVSVPVTHKGTQEVFMPNLIPGDYAISLFHDINANGRLDKNAIGVPTEAIGFSNNARVIFGPPSFNDAKFSVRTGDQLVRIRLRDRPF